MTPARPDPHQTRPTRDWTDPAIEWASGTTAVAMFAYGVALSYSVLHRIAQATGLPSWAARLWPLGFEAFMASAALNALADQRQRHDRPDWWQRVPWYPWVLTALTAGGSILLNWFHPAIPLDPPPGWLVSLVYGLPPLSAVFAWHLFLQRLAYRRQHEPASHDGDPAVAGQDSPQDEQDKQDAAGTPRTPVAEPAGDPRGRIRVLLAAETPRRRSAGGRSKLRPGCHAPAPTPCCAKNAPPEQAAMANDPPAAPAALRFQRHHHRSDARIVTARARPAPARTSRTRRRRPKSSLCDRHAECVVFSLIGYCRSHTTMVL